MAVMDTLNWGILGTALIARERIIPVLQRSSHSRVKAIASRDAEKAKECAKQFKIPKFYDSYQALVDDQEITVVYIPLPNSLHIPWSIRALQAGKHVLCEKPVSITASDMLNVIETAARFPELKIMEAFMYRFHPQWHRVKEIIQSGKIGELRQIHSIFSFFDENPASILNIRALGGGSLLDIGCYCVSLSRYLFETEPVRVLALMDLDPRYQTDRQTSAIMDFGQGKTATFTSHTQVSEHQKVTLLGTEGSIRMPTPFITPSDKPASLCVETGGKNERILIGPYNQYSLQIDQFVRSILDHQEVSISLQDSFANMSVMDAVVRSAHTGGWEYILDNRDG